MTDESSSEAKPQSRSGQVAQARAYVKTFRRYTMRAAKCVDTQDRRIELDKMTDDALFVAGAFARMEAEVARRLAARRPSQ